ncbi:MAG: peptidylprolyl isomerase SurA [Chromatiales bacterium]|nr:peptidylprolyl isomerase SurA [Gammaproteobacteria bacterium]MBW6477371.1 peptidylprolyl isomerase SurA [Chromatiales bacterium]
MTNHLFKPLFLLPLLLLLALGNPLQAAIQEINSIVAVVDNDIITRSELNQRVQTVLQQIRQQGAQQPPRELLERQVLERMIVEKLQLAQAREVGLQIDDEQLNAIIANIAGENNMSLTELRQTLATDGVPFAFFREQIRNEVLISRVRSNQVESRVDVSPTEVDTFLDAQQRQQGESSEYRLRHILVSLPSNASPEQLAEARARAEDLHRQLREGADFTNLAIAYSDGQQALEGGDLGWRRAGQLPTLFAEVVMAMQVGQVSEPIRSSNGFHLLLLADKRGEARHMVRQANARHILIRVSELVSDAQAQQRLERLRERLLSGASFAELARANSEDPGSAANGGELGWADPEIYVPEFRNTLRNLEDGEISQVFRSQFGWHIMQLQGWREHDGTDEARRNQAFQALRERKTEEAMQNWLRNLRDEAYVEYRLER